MHVPHICMFPIFACSKPSVFAMLSCLLMASTHRLYTRMKSLELLPSVIFKEYIRVKSNLGLPMLGIPMLLLPLVNPMACPTSSWRDLTQERTHHSMQHTAHSTAQHRNQDQGHKGITFWRHEMARATTAQHNMTMRSQGHHSTAQHCTVRNIPELQTIL